MSVVERPEAADRSDQVWGVRPAYDSGADRFEDRPWFRFWEQNERPLVRAWLDTLPHATGLDAGAGTGPYLNEIGAAGHRCVQVDLSRSMLLVGLGRRNAPPQVALGCAQADVRVLPFRDRAFRWALCTRVLSHVRHPEAVLSELHRVVGIGGELLITDVHPEHWYQRTTALTARGKIGIETYKHSLDALRRVTLALQPDVSVDLKEYRLDDLTWKPRQDQFARLYADPQRPVFYTLQVRIGAITRRRSR